jgi:DNA repair protein RadC
METQIESSLHLVAEIQLTYKSHVKPSQRPKISGSHDVYEILKRNWDDSKIEFVEQFKLILVNIANKVPGIVDISTGGVSSTIADPKLIFAATIKANASGFIVAHNHPSGNLAASQADIDLTRKLNAGGKLLEVQLLDHVIMTSESYLSFADSGLL